MEIRRARHEDLPVLMTIYDAARAFMRSRGNTVQWVGGYPSREMVAEGIEAGNQWVCMAGDGKGAGAADGDCGGIEGDGRIVATFWFAVAPEPTYERIYDGAWLTDGPFEEQPYGVVHRLASDGSTKGVGEACLFWCLMGCGNLRVDTHRDNTPMRDILERAGFTRCGEIIIGDGTPRDAYQKKIN